MNGPPVNLEGLRHFPDAIGGLQMPVFLRALAHVLKYTSLRVLKS